MKNLLTLVIVLFAIQLHGQSISVELDRDSILQHNQFSVTVKLENIEGEFTPPEFDGLEQRGSSYFMSSTFENGTSKSVKGYTYTLYANEIGSFMVPPISIETEQGILETDPIEIIIYPNPEGIIQKVDDHSFQGFSKEKPFFRFLQEEEQAEKPKTPSRKLKRI